MKQIQLRGKPFQERIAALLCLAVLLGICLSGCGQNGEQIETLDDLRNKTIVTKIGEMHSVAVKENEKLADAEVVYALSNANCLGMLMQGKVQAFATDYLAAQTMLQEYNGLKILDEEASTSCYGFGFTKGDPLVAEFNRVILQMKDNGQIRLIVEKWTDGEDESVPEQTWSGKNGTLKCLVSPTIEPICYRNDDGRLCGIDIELLLAIAEKLDYTITFAEDSFEDLIPAVAAGQADFAASGITVTEERNEYVDFTEGYLDAGTALIVLDSDYSTAKGFGVSVMNSIRRTFVEEGRGEALLGGLCTTLMLIFVTIALGLVFGGALFLWQYSGSKLAAKLLPAVSFIFGLLPFSTWLLICYYIIFGRTGGAGFAAAIFGLSFSYSISVYGTLMGGLGSIPAGQIDAAVAMGYDKWAALKNILFPQILPKFLAGMGGATVGHIKCTALVEFIAVQDIQAIADMISGQTAEPFLPLILTAVVYVLLGAIASKLIERLRMRLCPDEVEEEAVRKRMMKRGRAKW